MLTFIYSYVNFILYSRKLINFNFLFQMNVILLIIGILIFFLSHNEGKLIKKWLLGSGEKSRSIWNNFSVNKFSSITVLFVVFLYHFRIEIKIYMCFQSKHHKYFLLLLCYERQRYFWIPKKFKIISSDSSIFLHFSSGLM